MWKPCHINGYTALINNKIVLSLLVSLDYIAMLDIQEPGSKVAIEMIM